MATGVRVEASHSGRRAARVPESSPLEALRGAAKGLGLPCCFSPCDLERHDSACGRERARVVDSWWEGRRIGAAIGVVRVSSGEATAGRA